MRNQFVPFETNVHEPQSVERILEAATPSIDSAANLVIVMLLAFADPTASLTVIVPVKVAAGSGSAKVLADDVSTKFIEFWASVTLLDIGVIVGAEAPPPDELALLKKIISSSLR